MSLPVWASANDRPGAITGYVRSATGAPQMGAVVQILGSPLIAMLMLLFIGTNAYHMWLSMQEIIVDYVHDEFWKLVSLMANTFFCVVTSLACAYAIFKLSFGV